MQITCIVPFIKWFAKNERGPKADIKLNSISIASNFAFIFCVYKENMVKHVLYSWGSEISHLKHKH